MTDQQNKVSSDEGSKKPKKKLIRRRKVKDSTMEVDEESAKTISSTITSIESNEQVKNTKRKRKAEDTTMEVDKKADEPPSFPPAKKEKLSVLELRKLPVPQNRVTPLRDNWQSIYTPVVEHLKLQIRYNVKARVIEMRTSKETTDPTSIQRAADFIQAFLYGFDVEDALALIRLDDLYLETFDIQDVKQSLQGDHLSRAIGRVAGKGGKTKFTIENATRTRIVVANSKIHTLGSFQNIQIARRAICNLILGSPPSKVFGNLKSFAESVRERM